MSVAIGLDFGSLGYRAAYMLNGQIVPVPIPPNEEIWQGLLFVDPDPNVLPLGFSFSSLKYQLGSHRRFDWRGASQLPAEVVQRMIADLKRAVETYAGEEIARAVIAVPAQYPAARRAALRELAGAAGFGQVHLINDCTAAALGHAYEDQDRPRTLLLYSMGFIGFEVCLVRYASRNLRELDHEGRLTPSGRDFDQHAMAATIETLRQKGAPLPTRVFTSQWFDFRILASALKEQLSTSEEATLELPPYITGTDAFSVRFRRDRFESAIARQIDVTLEAVDQALENAGVPPEAVDEVVLVGGSTRIGMIQSRLGALFGDRLVQPRRDLIARGAAVQASRIEELGDAKASLPAPRSAPPAASPLPSASAGVVESRSSLLAAKPDCEPLFAYARGLADSGGCKAAREFLLELEERCREIRERLPRE